MNDEEILFRKMDRIGELEDELSECRKKLAYEAKEKRRAIEHATVMSRKLAECREALVSCKASNALEEWADVKAEMEAQVDKWGEQHHPDGFWHLILAEEVGEVAQAILQRKRGDIEREIVQCAAVCLSWLRDRARYSGEDWGWTS